MSSLSAPKGSRPSLRSTRTCRKTCKPKWRRSWPGPRWSTPPNEFCSPWPIQTAPQWVETIRLLCLQVHQHVKGYFKASLNISVGFWCFLKLQYYDTASVCVSTGRGGNSAESCRRPGLCPSSPSGPAAQPFSFFWKAGRSVRKLHGGSTFVLLFFFKPFTIRWLWSCCDFPGCL